MNKPNDSIEKEFQELYEKMNTKNKNLISLVIQGIYQSQKNTEAEAMGKSADE